MTAAEAQTKEMAAEAKFQWERAVAAEARIAAALAANNHCECGNSASVYSALTRGDQ